MGQASVIMAPVEELAQIERGGSHYARGGDKGAPSRSRPQLAGDPAERPRVRHGRAGMDREPRGHGHRHRAPEQDLPPPSHP